MFLNFPARALFSLPVLFLLGGTAAGRDLVLNPYEKVDWENTGRYAANLHAHTAEAGGFFPLEEVVAEYARKGFKIISITNHNELTWPWQDHASFPADAPPLGVAGFEASSGNIHHIGVYFCPEVPRAPVSEADLLSETGRLGALAVLFHTGRYEEKGFLEDGRYEVFFRDHSHLVGMEVFNAGNRYPGDRALWDKLLGRLMPGRPVWGFSNDDLYFLFQAGLNVNTFLLEELSEAEVRRAMEEGRFYFSFVPPTARKAPVIESLVHDGPAGTITLRARGHESIEWISRGEVVHRGEVFPYREAEGVSNYFRAELSGPGGSLTLTNPFGVGAAGNPRPPARPDSACFMENAR